MESLHAIILFEFTLLSIYIPAFQHQDCPISQLLFPCFNGDCFLFTRNQREEVI